MGCTAATRLVLSCLFAIGLLHRAAGTTWSEEPAPEMLDLQLRTRVETFKGSGQWDEVTLQKHFSAAETAIVLCDVWDKHWCRGASERCDALAKKMAPVVDAARARGVLIVHAPSDTIDFYRDDPARLRIANVARVMPPRERQLADPPLPIDDSDGGCDTPEGFYLAWSRQHPAISIEEPDVVSADGAEVYSYLHARGIKNIIYMGVHTNMCVLNRTFAIRQMTRWGMNCVLVRDLTDTMYDPHDPPHVSHDEGTELVVQHIEKYWAPSILSRDLLRQAPDQ